MADVCGPFTLEQLDLFGNIDGLAFSLDSAVWTSADTCILEFSGAITGEGTATAGGYLIRDGEGAITGSGEVVAAAYREREGEGSILGSAELTATSSRIRDGQAEFFAEGFLEATGGLEFNAVAFVLGDGELYVFPQRTTLAAGSIIASGSLNAPGYIYGEEWSVVNDEANTWTTVSPESNVWTTVTPGTNTWQLRG